jgi:hypothetical protein
MRGVERWNGGSINVIAIKTSRLPEGKLVVASILFAPRGLRPPAQGCPPKAGYPGYPTKNIVQPQRGCAIAARRRNPVGVEETIPCDREPRVGRWRGRPWAGGRNAVGVEARQYRIYRGESFNISLRSSITSIGQSAQSFSQHTMKSHWFASWPCKRKLDDLNSNSIRAFAQWLFFLS